MYEEELQMIRFMQALIIQGKASKYNKQAMASLYTGYDYYPIMLSHTTSATSTTHLTY